MQPSREAEWCSLITATLPSWGPGGLIEFFTHPGKRRRGLPEDRQENMVLKTWLNNCLSVCLSERYQLVTDCLSASVTVSLHACRPHIWTEPTSEYFNSLPAWRAGAAVLSMSACLPVCHISAASRMRGKNYPWNSQSMPGVQNSISFEVFLLCSGRTTNAITYAGVKSIYSF